MQDEFVNRLEMFTTSLSVLDRPEHKALWENNPPRIFTTKVNEARVMIGAIKVAQQRQEADTTGAADEKEREETELEDAAHLLAGALAVYYADTAQEAQAAEVDLTISDWRRLRDQQLLAKANLVIEHAQKLAAGATAARAAEYGITPEAAAGLVKERDDYARLVDEPDVASAVRKALTQGFRPAFRLTEAKLKELDRLIGQFRAKEQGNEMLAAWKAARNVVMAGRRAAKKPPEEKEPPAAG